jgi:hypothetical protein
VRLHEPRQCGTVLMPTTDWPGADLVIEATGRHWEGLSHGYGRLRRQRLEVTTTGRGRAARLGTAALTLPP